MTHILVRSIFLIFIFFFGGFIQVTAHSTQLSVSSQGTLVLQKSLSDDESVADESIDLPSPSHKNAKDLRLPLFERTEEQELESKSLKKKTDQPGVSALSCTLLLHSLLFVNRNLSSPESLDLSVTTSRRYLRFRNLRS